jgi:hypothetical protein
MPSPWEWAEVEAKAESEREAAAAAEVQVRARFRPTSFVPPRDLRSRADCAVLWCDQPVSVTAQPSAPTGRSPSRLP